MTVKVIKSTEPTKTAIRKAHGLPTVVGRMYPDRKKPFLSNEFYEYNGYFKLLKVVDEEGNITFSIVDGSDYDNVSCGRAVINNQDFTIPKFTDTACQYIWLQSDYGEDGIGDPVIYTSDTFPSYEDNKCKILIARVIDDVPYQEHHGVAYGFILGDCNEEESSG